MASLIDTRGFVRFTPKGHERVIWRTAKATSLNPSQFDDALPEVIELTSQLTDDVTGLEPVETFATVANLGSDFEETYPASVTHGPIGLRLWADLTDKGDGPIRPHLVGNGWLYLFTGTTSVDSVAGLAGSLVDMWPVHTRGPVSQHAPHTLVAKTFSVACRVVSRPVVDQVVADDDTDGASQFGTAQWGIDEWS